MEHRHKSACAPCLDYESEKAAFFANEFQVLNDLLGVTAPKRFARSHPTISTSLQPEDRKRDPREHQRSPDLRRRRPHPSPAISALSLQNARASRPQTHT